MVILTLEWPSISLKLLISNPASTHLVAKVWRNVWKFVVSICALRWNDISLQENTLYVHQTLQRLQNENNSGKRTSLILSTPKSSCSIRTIPLPDDIVTILNTSFPKKEGYLLTGSDSYVEPRTMQNHFKYILTEAHIETTNFHTEQNCIWYLVKYIIYYKKNNLI